MTETANNTNTEPNPPAADPTPTVIPPADGGTPPAAADGSLLSDDPKPADGAPKPDDKPPAPAKPDGAPEKYEFTAPEGKVYDPQLLDSFSATAKELNLTQNNAQKLLETMAPKLAERQAEQVQTLQKQWRESSIADKEFGGEKLQANLGVAKQGLTQFASPELRTLLENTGLANHPEVIRMFYRVGKAISEDTFVGGKGGSKEPLENRFYPTMVTK